MSEPSAIAIDLGTTGLKVGIVTLEGRVLWTDHADLHTTLLPGGGAEQDAGDWWRLIAASVRRGMDAGVVARDDVVAVSTTGQWASTVPVDESGEPVGPCILWMDRRGGSHVRKRIGGAVAGYDARAIAMWIRRTGGAPSTSGADPIGHILHLDIDRPDIARAARWYLEPVDYVSMRFTGEASATHASMTGAWLTDNRHLDVLEYDRALLAKVGIDAGKLPPLRPTTTRVGTVRPDVARELGLGHDVAVIAGTPDLHSAAAGAGTMADFETHMALSTTSWISCPVGFKKTDALRQIATVPGVTPGRYLVADNHETAGACLQWLRDKVLDGAPSFDALTELAAKSSAGAGNVVFTPWLAGERSPVDDPSARGGFHNLSLATTRADMVRAVMEGVAYNARWLHEAVERFTKRELAPVRFFGGGAQSDLWAQIHADVMNRPIERLADPMHVGVRGAALLAGIALGAIDASQVRDLVEVDRTFTPDPANRSTYDALFAELPKLYKARKPMFKRLNRRRAAK